MIELHNVEKTYHSKSGDIDALHKTNLSINAGEIFGVIGLSGAGKSTLIRLLNGLEKPTTGSVTINGQDISAAKGEALRQARLKISMVFQHFNLLWSRTVSENIAFSMQIAGVPKAKIKVRVAELVELVGLKGREQAYPSQLSGGQKQRVGIARALANSPDVLLCDEATSALDPQTTDQILDLLLDINRRFRLTIVLITHEMQVIREICDQVVVIDHGEIAESGQVWSVFSSPQQKITQELLNLEQLDLPIAYLPDRQPDSAYSILKLRYESAVDQSPNLKTIFEQFDAPVHLLQSHVDTIQNHLIGSFIIALKQTDADFNALSAKLRPSIAQLEVLGYAKSAY